MEYQTLARKYRPQSFGDVVGQDTVIRTLTNSIKSSRVSNAYIFTGPRGVGKTTVARLIAKTLNCQKPVGTDPCDKCVSCREIALSNNIDVLEIDGASNNGVDEIRVLRENVKFSPSQGKFKIYIIDEVHMLSQGAFNALLKTLEEPPAHVKFIFATTESHKVLPTIMSRCQRFDFKRIPPHDIVDRVLAIAEKEKIDVDKKAALIIARAADGSLRDALVVLDQMIAFSGKKVSADDVMELLGMVKGDRIIALADAVIGRDPAEAARILDEIISGGKDPVFITNNIIEYFRDIMILKTAGPTSDMTFTDEELVDIRKRSDSLSLNETLYILQNLTHCITLMKGTMFTRAPLEIALVRLAGRDNILSLKEISDRLDNRISEYMENAPEILSAAGDRSQDKHSHAGENEEMDVMTDEVSGGGMLDEIDGNGEDVPDGAFLKPLNAYWKTILSRVKEKKMSVFTFLSVAKPVELTRDKIVIGFGSDHSFNKEVLESPDNRAVIEEAVRKVTSFDTRVEFSLLEFLSEKSDKDKEESVKKKADDRNIIKPVIEKAMDIFGGHVVRDMTEEK